MNYHLHWPLSICFTFLCKWDVFFLHFTLTPKDFNFCKLWTYIYLSFCDLIWPFDFLFPSKKSLIQIPYASFRRTTTYCLCDSKEFFLQLWKCNVMIEFFFLHCKVWKFNTISGFEYCPNYIAGVYFTVRKGLDPDL